MHRPRTDGAGGKRHNKRVRAPHNTREKQRQIAIGHGETLMPNNVIYRTPNSAISNEDSAYNSIGYDGRPNRPDSIEIRRSYQTEPDGYIPNAYQHAGYATSQQLYDEQMYNAQNMYAGHNQGAMSPENPYGPGTPTKGKSRPSQPPPAPPSTGNTPNASNANTPTRSNSRNIQSRDALPPPPPVPMETMHQSPPMQQMTNGNASVAAKILARSNSTSRSGSPHLSASGVPMDANALVMAQLNSQINNLNHLNLQMTQQMNAINDLPPPPPIPEQVIIFSFPFFTKQRCFVI